MATNALPETFVDHAEEIWVMLDIEGATQQSVADELGWKKQRVQQYASLRNICNSAWSVVTTATLNSVAINADSGVVDGTTSVVFTEGLLRSITYLYPDQQIELVEDLVDGDITKAKFKNRAMLAEGKTQQQVADEIGWSRVAVKNYVALKNICESAWMVIGTVFQKNVPNTVDDNVPKAGTTVPMTENLLRNITNLQPDQQHELVKNLISGDINKSRFTKLAEAYKARDKAALFLQC